MRFNAIVALLTFCVIGLVGCSEDDSQTWDETDASWNDIEDVGGQKGDSGNPADAVSDVGDSVDVVEDVEPPGPASGRSWVLGTTRYDRPIVAEEFGESGPILYIMSAIHGSERTAVTFGERLRIPLQGGLAERAGVRVFYLGAANPDGIAAKTRHNHADIDLNRNFPSDNFDPSGPGGSEPLTEPESIVIHDTVVAIDPTALISVHCCVGVIDWDGPGESLSSKMATAAGFPANRIGSLYGSLGSFAGVDLQIPTVTVEFDLHEYVDTGLQLDRMEEATALAMEWAVEEDMPAQDFSIYDVVLPKQSPLYSALDMGMSAGSLSIRGERIGPESANPVLIVAGIDASDRNAMYVAEHIRHSVLALRAPRRIQTTIVTAANPDAIFMKSSRNAYDDDVAVDFGAGPSKTPEARALRELVTAGNFGIVILVDADANGDRIESFGVSAEKIQSIMRGSLEIVDGDIENLAEDSFIRYLNEQNVPVLRFAVHTKFAIGNSREGHVFEKIGVFSDAVRRLVERPVFP